MPTERELCDAFHLSRITVRRALLTLEEERLIVRRHGSGTYVSVQPERRIPVMIDYTGTMRTHAPLIERRLLRSERRPADPRTAEALRIADGAELLYAERLDSLGKQSVAWDQAYIPAPFAQGLNENHLARVDFVETWIKVCQFDIAVCHQTVDAVAADTTVSRRLGVKGRHPVLRTMELYVATNGRPAGLYVSYYHPSYISISSQHRWAATKPGK
jgi:DNA-binding GntR family transcriptional regulator